MSRRPLTRDRVLRAAIRIADEQGIEALSMRKLARALGVEAMSLYNHVANKQDLEDSIADLVLGEIALPSTGEWDEAIRECAISAHEIFVRHPWACSLVIGPRAPRLEDNPRLRYMEWMLRRLRDAGFSADLTYHAYHVLDSHILGFTLWELGHSGDERDLTGGRSLADFVAAFVPQLRASGYSYIAEHAEQHITPPDDGVRAFEFGLDLILDGLKRAAGIAD